MAPTRRALAGLTALCGLPGLAACGGGGEATPNTNTVTRQSSPQSAVQEAERAVNAVLGS